MSTTAKQVMDIKTSKGIAQSSNEQLRRWSENGWEQAAKEGNYDRSREYLNFEIARGGIVRPVDKEHTLSRRMAEILDARGIKDPNKGLDPPKYRTVVNIIFGGSRERMREMAFGSQEVDFEKGADNAAIRRQPEIEQWAKDIYDFVCGKWGEENIVSFIVHLDEQNPHIHCSLLPLDKDNKFAFKKLFSGKDKLEFKMRTLALHDELAKVNEKWGLGRGASVSETNARHRSTEEYRRWLSSECSTLEEDIDNHRKSLSELQKEIAIAEKKAKSFSTMIANLTTEKENIEHQLATLRDWLESGEEDSEVLARKIGNLEWQLSQTEEKLAARQVQLAQTEEQLAVLKADREQIQNEADDLSAKALQSEKSWSMNLTADLHAVMLEKLVNEFQPRLQRMSAEDQQLFDSTLLSELAEDGNKVVTVGLQLMAGYVDEATQFAQTHGGGGGGSNMPWGRNPDEDDRQWARRCLAMARKMMRPASGKRKKL